MICNRCGHQGADNNWVCPRCGNTMFVPQRQDYAGGRNYTPPQSNMAPYGSQPTSPGDASGNSSRAASMMQTSQPGSPADPYNYGLPVSAPAQEYDLSVLNGMLHTEPVMQSGGNPPGYFANSSAVGNGSNGTGQNVHAPMPQQNTYNMYGMQRIPNPYAGQPDLSMPTGQLTPFNQQLQPGQQMQFSQQPQPGQQPQSSQQLQMNPPQNFYKQPQTSYPQYGGQPNQQAMTYGKPYQPQGTQPNYYDERMLSQPSMYTNPYGAPGSQPATLQAGPSMMPGQTPTPRTFPGDTGRIYLTGLEMGTGEAATLADVDKTKSPWIPWLIVLIVVLIIFIGLLLGYYFGADTPFTLENLWAYYQNLLNGLFGSSGT